MKVPSNQDLIFVHGSQEAVRRAKGSWTDSKAIHNIDETEAHVKHKQIKDKVVLEDQVKVVLLYEDIAKQKVLFGSQSPLEQARS
jgi:hypothetical protein